MTIEITTRPAVAEDIPALIGFLLGLDAHVAGVDREILRPNADGRRDMTQRLEAFLADPDKFLVIAEALQDGRAVPVRMGNIQIWRYADLWHNPERKGVSAACIDDFWIEPEYRRHGGLKALLAPLLDFAAEHGIDQLVLEYSLANAEAEAVWSRLGFTPTGVRASALLSDIKEKIN